MLRRTAICACMILVGRVGDAVSTVVVSTPTYDRTRPDANPGPRGNAAWKRSWGKTWIDAPLANTPAARSHRSSQGLEKTPVACAIFFAYGSRARKGGRYELEINRTLTRLKRLNPGVHIILATDNPSLQQQGLANQIIAVEFTKVTQWKTRLKIMSNMSHHAPQCDVTAALDSHVTLCSSNLYSRMREFYMRRDTVIGANVEHAPQPAWYSSPFAYTNAKYQHLPHNFALMWKNGQTADDVLEEWYFNMVSMMPVDDARVRAPDDQVPLRDVLGRQGVHLTRLQESFTFAFKSVHKHKFGFNPRFSYLVEGPITMIHSYNASAVPDSVARGDICSFINSDMRPRIVWQESRDAKYELLFSFEECQAKMARFEPKICQELLADSVTTINPRLQPWNPSRHMNVVFASVVSVTRRIMHEISGQLDA